MDVLCLNRTRGEGEVLYKLRLMDLFLEPGNMGTVPLDYKEQTQFFILCSVPVISPLILRHLTFA